MIRSLMFSLVLVVAPAAMANQQQLALNDADDFRAQRAQIEKGLADGKTYAEISSSDRIKVRESLDRISRRLEGQESIDALNEAAKVDLFNDQELVNSILTQAAADSRLVCDRSKATGSHRAKNTCQTVGERRRRMEADREHLQKVQNGIGPPNN